VFVGLGCSHMLMLLIPLCTYSTYPLAAKKEEMNEKVAKGLVFPFSVLYYTNGDKREHSFTFGSNMSQMIPRPLYVHTQRYYPPHLSVPLSLSLFHTMQLPFSRFLPFLIRLCLTCLSSRYSPTLTHRVHRLHFTFHSLCAHPCA
jgi:hypothetical protein